MEYIKGDGVGMIFITLGSQKFQFNRLLKKIDELYVAGVIQDEVFAQIGYSDYEPHNYKFQKFCDREAFAEKMDAADVVITHAGTGAIITAVKKGKKVIAVPRKAEYGEHVDDHQIQIVQQFEELQLICGCEDSEELGTKIKNIHSMKFKKYQSNTQVIINDIEEYIESIWRV